MIYIHLLQQSPNLALFSDLDYLGISVLLKIMPQILKITGAVRLFSKQKFTNTYILILVWEQMDQ